MAVPLDAELYVLMLTQGMLHKNTQKCQSAMLEQGGTATALQPPCLQLWKALQAIFMKASHASLNVEYYS